LNTPGATLSSTPGSPQPVVGGGDTGQANPPPEHPRTDDQILEDAGQQPVG